MANQFVRKMQALTSLTSEEADVLDQLSRVSETYEPRTDLVYEGDRPGPMLIVLEGWAFRYKLLPRGTRQITAFLMPGDSCDLNVGLLSEMDYSIRTQTQVKVARADRSKINRLMLAHPGVARAFYVSQLVDESTMRAWIVSLGRRNSVERLAHLLLEIYVRGVRSGIAVQDTIALPLSQSVLADALGLTPVHVNRVLRDLRRDGIIDLERRMLHVLDPAALTRLSGFDESYLSRRIPSREVSQH